jgi:hypothetical protein
MILSRGSEFTKRNFRFHVTPQTLTVVDERGSGLTILLISETVFLFREFRGLVQIL